MNILSLFNGLGGLPLACDRAGISYDKCYYSEIDKYANMVMEKNYPDSIPLGDVTKWREWDIDWSSIGLVSAGFPCQNWSVAGKQQGDKDERGMLFWTTLEVISQVLKHNPKAKFLMENVKMKKEFEQYITYHTEQALGDVEKILINSALVSAQNRNRYYWTNFKVEQPEDKGILLKDVVDGTPIDLYSELENDIRNGKVASEQNLNGISQTMQRALNNGRNPTQKANNLTACAYKGMGTNGMTNVLINELRPCERIKEGNEGHIANATDIKGMDCIKRVYGQDGKAPTLTTMGGGHREPKVLINESSTKDGKAYSLTASYGGAVAWNSCEKKQRTMIPIECSNELKPNVYNGLLYRKLTPVECERLQTIPDNWTDCVSNTQRYKMIGNGWTIDVIAHILKHINC